MFGATSSSRPGLPGAENASYCPRTLPDSHAIAPPSWAAVSREPTASIPGFAGLSARAETNGSSATPSPAMLDWIHSPRSTTTAGACSGSASRPVSARTGSRASWASSRSSATTPWASVGVVVGPLGMNRNPICSARAQSTRFATWEA